MPDSLTLVVDKFTFRVPQDRRYSKDDCWLLEQGDHLLVGLTDFRQQASGDIAFVELPASGLALAQGEEMVAVETIKVTLAIPAPISGIVRNTNTALATQPELVNHDPYGEGWLVEMTVAAPQQLDGLLSAADYFALMSRNAEIAGRER